MRNKNTTPRNDDSWRRICYVLPEDSFVAEHGFRAAVCVEGEPGYRPTGTWPYTGAPGEVLPYFRGPNLDRAKETIVRQNARLGLSSSDVEEIVSLSFVAQSLGRSMSKEEVAAWVDRARKGAGAAQTRSTREWRAQRGKE